MLDYQTGIIVVGGRQQRSFAYTYANWREVPSLPREMEYREPDFVSRSGSQYWYTNSGVYRKSDHWGRRIGTCEWYIDGCSYDELVSIIGYCRWDDFVDLERTSMRRRAYKDDWLGEWLNKRKRLFQFYELESYLGYYIDDYDIDAIINEATEVDYNDGKLYWIEDVDLDEIADRHMLRHANRRRTVWEDRDLERTSMRKRASNRRMTAAHRRFAGGTPLTCKTLLQHMNPYQPVKIDGLGLGFYEGVVEDAMYGYDGEYADDRLLMANVYGVESDGGSVVIYVERF